MRSTFTLFAVTLAASTPVLASEAIPVSKFNAIELRAGGEVQLRPGPVQRVTLVEGSSQYTNIRVRRDQKLEIDTCNSRCPKHYRMRVIVESPTMPQTLAVNGGGSITAESGFGNQRELTVAIGGGGTIDVRAVPAETATAAVSGGGAIKIRSLRELTAAVNGGGEVRYWGNPSVTTAINGGGTVRPGG